MTGRRTFRHNKLTHPYKKNRQRPMPLKTISQKNREKWLKYIGGAVLLIFFSAVLFFAGDNEERAAAAVNSG